MKKEKITKDVKLSIRITKKDRDFAEKLMRKKGIKISKFIRQSILDFIESQPPEPETQLSLNN